MRILASYSTSNETVLTLPSEKEFKSTPGPVLPPLHMDTHKLVTDLTSAGLKYCQFLYPGVYKIYVAPLGQTKYIT